MSDFLTGLAARAMGAAPSVALRTRSRFESVDPGASGASGASADFPEIAAQIPQTSQSDPPPVADVALGTAFLDARPEADAPSRPEEPRLASIDSDPRPLLVPAPSWHGSPASPTSTPPGESVPPGQPPADSRSSDPLETRTVSQSAGESTGGTVAWPQPASTIAREGALPSRLTAAAESPAPPSPLRPASLLVPGQPDPGPEPTREPDPEPKRFDRADLMPVVSPRIDPFPITTWPQAAASATIPPSGATPAPVIRVSIGRIEVRAAPATPAPTPARPSRKPQLSLTDYLRGAK